MKGTNVIQASQAKPSLEIHEWAAIWAILGCLGVLTMVSIVCQRELPKDAGLPHYLADPAIEVFVQGAVEHPGALQLKHGSTLGAALEMARPLPHADLRKFNPQRKVRSGQVIKIPSRQMLTVHFRGEVAREGPVLIPKGTALRDVGDYVEFTGRADLAKLARARRIKEGETIEVPAKDEGQQGLKGR